MARRHEHAVDIDLHDPAPVLRSHVDDTAATTYSDIVVEAIEPAELRECGVDHHPGAGAGQQDGRRAAIADAVIRRSAPGDDRYLAFEAEAVCALPSLRHP